LISFAPINKQVGLAHELSIILKFLCLSARIQAGAVFATFHSRMPDTAVQIIGKDGGD